MLRLYFLSLRISLNIQAVAYQWSRMQERVMKKMGQWSDSGEFEITNIQRANFGAVSFIDFEIHAAAPILRAWSDGQIFYEKNTLIRCCYGCIAVGNNLHVKRLAVDSEKLPQITVELSKRH